MIFGTSARIIATKVDGSRPIDSERNAKPMTSTRQEQFLLLINANKGLIYKVARAYCSDAENRQDLIQEVIIQLWQSFDQYNDQFKQSTWIYRIALNVAISFYRKDTRRKSISLPITDERLLTIGNDEPSETENNLRLLQQFLAELKELDRALMFLYLEEKSHQQIAEILGISTTNVSTKIGRIKEQLKRKFSTLTT